MHKMEFETMFEKLTQKDIASGTITEIDEKHLSDVAGGSVSTPTKTYRCPACGWDAKPTGHGCSINSHCYYPTGIHWEYKCANCGKVYLECELDGTVPPWDNETVRNS